MSFSWEGGGWSTSDVMTLPGVQASRDATSGRWMIAGNWTAGSGLYSCDFDLEVDPDPFLGATLTFTNNSGIAQPFTANLLLPIAPPVVPSSLISGSTSGSVRDSQNGGGATMSNSGTTAFYTGLIDATPVRTLGDAPFSVSAAPFLTQGFDFGSFVSEPSIAALASIGIDHAFTLTGGGDSVAFTTTLVVVPEPATMAVLLLGAFAIVRRSR